MKENKKPGWEKIKIRGRIKAQLNKAKKLNNKVRIKELEKQLEKFK